MARIKPEPTPSGCRKQPFIVGTLTLKAKLESNLLTTPTAHIVGLEGTYPFKKEGDILVTEIPIPRQTKAAWLNLSPGVRLIEARTCVACKRKPALPKQVTVRRGKKSGRRTEMTCTATLPKAVCSMVSALSHA